MGAPSVPYEMLAAGYKVTSGTNGFKAEASFLVFWDDAFTFHDDIMGYGSATTVGPVSYNSAWQFPGSTTAVLRATSCEIEPIHPDGSPIAAALGMKPGEYWSHARIAVTFETPQTPGSAADDPGDRNQLDPSNPIYNCEQTVHIGSKSEDHEKEAYEFQDVAAAAKKPKKTVSVFKGETNITLHWPFVPFVPWKRYRPFVNRINSTPFLDCAIGEILFQGVRIEGAQSPNGKIGKSVTVDLLVNDHDWNKKLHPETGLYKFIQKSDGTKPYEYIEFRQLLFPSDV